MFDGGILITTKDRIHLCTSPGCAKTLHCSFEFFMKDEIKVEERFKEQVMSLAGQLTNLHRKIILSFWAQ